MSPQPSLALESDKPPLGEFGRLTGVFFEPSATFDDIAARPRFLVPVALMMVLAVTFIYLFTQRVGWEHTIRTAIEASPQAQNLPEEKRGEIIAQQSRFAPIFGYAAAALGTPIYLLISAGVLLAAFNLVAGAQLTFKKMFAVTAYACLPLALSSILTIVVLYLKTPEDFNLMNPTAFNIGAFLDPTPRWLQSLGASIDLFSIWIMALLGIGAARASGKMTFGKALTLVVVCWAFWVVIKSGWLAITG